MVVCTTALSACVSVGPNFRSPQTPSTVSYTRTRLPVRTSSAPGALGAAQELVPAQTVAGDWWKSFGSSPLNTLVERALRNNPTLAAAEATLRQAREVYAAQAGGTRLPTVGARLGATRSQINPSSFGQSGGTETLFTLYNAGISVNYNLDLFGANRRALEALAAQADYERYQFDAARLSVAANVVTTAFSRAQLAAQIDATQAILKAQQSQVEIAQKRFQLGATSRTDVLALQAQMEQTRASLPQLRNRLEQADHLLAVLAGQEPGAADIPRFSLADFTLPTRLPTIVPSEVLRQRPDIQASTALLHVATAKYGVAVSELYPQINLSGSLGTQALTTEALFGPGSTVWSLAGQLAQPLFNGGLKAARNAARANLQAAGANYRQTVLQALRNVADTLRQLENDADVMQAEAAADAASQESLRLVQQQYKLGAASYLQLLTAQQQAQQTRIGLIAAQRARLADSAALYEAMGGGVLGTQHRPKNSVTVGDS
jgi:NodT family efflux transporter outer membrane factor (OMF) lipoprotein